MAEMTLDQQRALALASARARAAQIQNANGAADSGSGTAPITLNDATNAIARGVPVIGSARDRWRRDADAFRATAAQGRITR